MLLLIGVVLGLALAAFWVCVLRARAETRHEEQTFGNGDHAPYWPHRSLNGDWTLHRGVWVRDGCAVPSNNVLDEFRETHLKRSRFITFTLVEGEQDAPFGKDGALIRVKASQGIPGKLCSSDGSVISYIPMIRVAPVNPTYGGWKASGFNGSLPMEISVNVADAERADARG